MTKKCCVYNCKTNYKSEKDKHVTNEACSSGSTEVASIPVYRFPSEKTDPNDRARWIEVIGKINADFIVCNKTVVCELHWPQGYENCKKKGHWRPKNPPSVFPGIAPSIIPEPPAKPRETQRTFNQARNTLPDEIEQFEQLDKFTLLKLKEGLLAGSQQLYVPLYVPKVCR